MRVLKVQARGQVRFLFGFMANYGSVFKAILKQFKVILKQIKEMNSIISRGYGIPPPTPFKAGYVK
jgi:hypothetical protein